MLSRNIRTDLLTLLALLLLFGFSLFSSVVVVWYLLLLNDPTRSCTLDTSPRARGVAAAARTVEWVSPEEIHSDSTDDKMFILLTFILTIYKTKNMPPAIPLSLFTSILYGFSLLLTLPTGEYFHQSPSYIPIVHGKIPHISYFIRWTRICDMW